jgi:hypothetical protein
VITAKHALTTLTDEDQAALVAAEKRIDGALAQYEGRPVLVDFERTNTRRKVLDKLCEMYRANGWNAEIKSGDQRDPGPWIEFTITGTPRSGPGR